MPWAEAIREWLLSWLDRDPSEEAAREELRRTAALYDRHPPAGWSEARRCDRRRFALEMAALTGIAALLGGACLVAGCTPERRRY